MTKKVNSTCTAHVWSSLQCDGREHYYICVRRGCPVREYFSKCTCHRRPR